MSCWLLCACDVLSCALVSRAWASAVRKLPASAWRTLFLHEIYHDWIACTMWLRDVSMRDMWLEMVQAAPEAAKPALSSSRFMMQGLRRHGSLVCLQVLRPQLETTRPVLPSAGSVRLPARRDQQQHYGDSPS
jgi:hypothetical protein